jgi:hypothetical protein
MWFFMGYKGKGVQGENKKVLIRQDCDQSVTTLSGGSMDDNRQCV